MSDVQRFSMTLAPYTDDYEMRPEPDGDYVRSEDYDALRSRLASVERERDEIMAMAERREDALRARLAEAEALLRLVQTHVPWPEKVQPHPHPLCFIKDRIDAFLASDSAGDALRELPIK